MCLTWLVAPTTQLTSYKKKEFETTLETKSHQRIETKKDKHFYLNDEALHFFHPSLQGAVHQKLVIVKRNNGLGHLTLIL